MKEDLLMDIHRISNFGETLRFAEENRHFLGISPILLHFFVEIQYPKKNIVETFRIFSTSGLLYKLRHNYVIKSIMVIFLNA